MPNSSSTKNVIRGAAIGIGTIGLIAVLAISIVTLVNVNKNKSSNNDKVTVVNNNLTVPTVNNTGVYNNTQNIYNNASIINYNSDVNFYYGNNETDQTTIFVYNNTEYIINNNFTDIQMFNNSETFMYNYTDNKYYYINNTEFYNFTEVLYYFFNGSDANEILNIYSNEPSNTQKYQEAAKLFGDAMDISVNPCDDFYQYACGKYDKDMGFDIATDENYRKMAAAFNKENDSDPLPVKQVKRMYHQCVIDTANWGTITANGTFLKNLVTDFAAQTKLPFPLLQNLHPLLPSPTLASMAIGYLSGKHGIDTLISQYIDTNNKDPLSDKPYMLILDQPTLTYPWTYYIGATWDYTKPKLTNRVEEILAGYVNISGFDISSSAIDEVVEKIVEFEYVLANNYSTDAKTRWQSSRSYNLIKIQDFNARYPSFSIKTYLQQIAQNADPKVVQLITASGYQIQIAEPERMAQMSAALNNSFGKQFTPDIFGNYFYYRLLEGYMDYYPDTLVIEDDEFLDKFKLKRPIRGKPRFEGIRMPSTSSKRYTKSGYMKSHAHGYRKSTTIKAPYSYNCVDDTVNYFQYANARVFIDKIWPSQSDRDNIRKAVSHIADTILVGMESMIDQLSWMKPESKKGAYSKIQYLVRNIAYPDWITVDANLTKYYSSLHIDFMSGNYPEMLAYLNALNQRLAFDQLAMKNGTNRKDFLGPPGTVNAWYQPEMNSITFPAAILRQPFFDPAWPASVNYGAMGVIAGHELTHAFDSSGTQWDSFGQLLGWLDSDSQQQFDNMTECVINEYSGFCPLDEEEYSPNCINGQQTVGENVADNGGIHAAFRAYRNTMNFYGPDPLLPGDIVSLLNHDQLFFLSFAQVWCQTTPNATDEYHQILVDPHSPSKFRVFGTIQNFPAFRSAFNCPVETNSAPKDHCNVWISDVNITKEASAASVLNIRENPTIKADNNLYTKYSQAQAFFAASMNLSADPCNNFYEYACGAYDKPLGFSIYRNKNYDTMATKYENMLKGYLGDMKSSTAINKTLNFYVQCKAAIKGIQYTNGSLPQIRNGSIVKSVMDEFQSFTGYAFNWCDADHLNTNIDPKAMAKALAFLTVKYGVNTLVSPFVDVNAYRDASYSSNYTLYLDQNTLTYDKSYYQSGAWEFYTKDTLKKNMEKMFLDYTTSIGLECEDYILVYNIKRIADFEQLLATNFSTDEITRRDYGRWVNPTYVKDIPYKFADWVTYIGELSIHSETYFAGKDIDNYLLNIAEKDPLAKLDAYISDTGVDIVIKYLYYRLLLSQKDFIYSPPTGGSKYVPLYDDENGHIGRASARHPGHKPRKDPFATAAATKLNSTQITEIRRACAEDTLNYIQYANARVFTEALYKNAAERETLRNETKKIITSIKSSMQSMLDDLPWIAGDEGSQEGARNKIKNLQINVAFPDFILNNTQLDAYHEMIKFDNYDDYFSMLKKLQIFNMYQNYKVLIPGTDVDRKDFLGPPGTVNAWYQPEQNSITIPEGILQQPYFDPQWPASIKFGGLGLIVGHEITHGFDDQGVQWNGDGILEDWMSDDSKAAFADMAECVVDEYGNFTVIQNTSYSPRKINGRQTQGENIADNGGIHAAYNSYLRWISLNGPDPQLPGRIFGQLSHDQIFFLSFAQGWCQPTPSDADLFKQILIDPHSPSKFRIFGTIQNFPAFRSAYNCPVNSAYAPQKHCSVWVPKN